jgi:hypothetical protein
MLAFQASSWKARQQKLVQLHGEAVALVEQSSAEADFATAILKRGIQ